MTYHRVFEIESLPPLNQLASTFLPNEDGNGTLKLYHGETQFGFYITPEHLSAEEAEEIRELLADMIQGPAMVVTGTETVAIDILSIKEVGVEPKFVVTELPPKPKTRSDILRDTLDDADPEPEPQAFDLPDKYSYSIAWSERDQDYVGLCAEFPELCFHAKSRVKALEGIVDRVQFAVEQADRAVQPLATPGMVVQIAMERLEPALEPYMCPCGGAVEIRNRLGICTLCKSRFTVKEDVHGAAKEAQWLLSQRGITLEGRLATMALTRRESFGTAEVAALLGLDEGQKPLFPSLMQIRLMEAWVACPEQFFRHLDETEELKASTECNPPGACSNNGRCWTHSDWGPAEDAQESGPTFIGLDPAFGTSSTTITVVGNGSFPSAGGDGVE